MHTLIRSLFAGLIAAFALAGPADAATATKVQIVQQSGGVERALAAAGTSFVFAPQRDVSNTTHQWLRRSAGGEFSTYESVRFPGKCLTTSPTSEQLRIGTCLTGNRRQMWTQGFSSAPLKKLENLDTGRVATVDSSRIRNATFHRVDGGLSTQRWRLVQG